MRLRDGEGVELLTTREAAKYLKRSSSTLNRWRYIGIGPPFIKMEKMGANSGIYYAREEIDLWLAEQSKS